MNQSFTSMEDNNVLQNHYFELIIYLGFNESEFNTKESVRKRTGA